MNSCTNSLSELTCTCTFIMDGVKTLQGHALCVKHIIIYEVAYIYLFTCI